MQALRVAAAVLAVSIVLSGCTTPTTVMRHPTTGQVATCGGNVSSSLAGGMIGYSIQRSTDEQCIATYAAQGFLPVR
jgi:hypothetical protein